MSVLKNSQYTKKKYNILSTKKHSFLLIKYIRHTTTTITIISCIKIEIDYLLAQVKTLEQKLDKYKKKTKNKIKVNNDSLKINRKN
jgi:hypothetical protein